MTIKHIIKPFEKDLGEFTVRRVLPYAKQRMVGPWIFFDHMGPVNFRPGEGISVRPHPHINLATVTYVFEGEILHRDSLGSVQTIRPGDLNLMVAGKGITHSERERDEINSINHRLHGLQLWHVLPKKDEEIEPAFYHYPEQDLPRLTKNGVPIRVMMGSAYDVTSPVRTFAETLYVEAHLQENQSLDLPTAQELAVYVASGSINIDGQNIPQYHMVVIEDYMQATITANTESRVGIVGGEKMGERFIEWNFVSSSKERIEQAKADWKAGRFPKVPGDEVEFIPLPE